MDIHNVEGALKGLTYTDNLHLSAMAWFIFPNLICRPSFHKGLYGLLAYLTFWFEDNTLSELSLEAVFIMEV